MGSSAPLLVLARNQWGPGAPWRTTHSPPPDRHSGTPPPGSSLAPLLRRLSLGGHRHHRDSFHKFFSSTWGHSLTVIYRRWHFPYPAISPPQGSILRNPSRPLVYHGSMATHDWFPEIFGTRDARASRITLVSSSGRPTAGGGTQGALSSLNALPLTVEVYRSVPYLPPSYVGRMGSSTPLASPELLLPSFPDQTPHHVYLALHTSTGFSPLQQAVDTGVHRVSLVLLHTSDHVSWSCGFTVAQSLSLTPVPSPRPFSSWGSCVLSGIIRRHTTTLPSFSTSLTPL